MNYEFYRRNRGRTLKDPRNPLTDPLAHVKQPLSRVHRWRLGPSQAAPRAT